MATGLPFCKEHFKSRLVSKKKKTHLNEYRLCEKRSDEAIQRWRNWIASLRSMTRQFQILSHFFAFENQCVFRA